MRQFDRTFPLPNNFQSEIGKSSAVAVDASAHVSKPCRTARNGAEINIRLRSAVGERKQWSADGETDGTESERNAAAEPQTEAPANADNQMQLVTRARLAKSEAQQSALWSRRLKVLVGQLLSGVGVNLAACEQLGMDGSG